jgi:hypothetical protein
VRDAAPTKTLAGLPLRHTAGVEHFGSVAESEKKLLSVPQVEPSEAQIEREQLERMQQRFGAHDGL